MIPEGNGHNELTNTPQQCPFLDRDCMGDKCKLHVELLQSKAPGLQQKVGTCSFAATVLILSEINIKTVGRQERVTIPPGLFRS